MGIALLVIASILLLIGLISIFIDLLPHFKQGARESWAQFKKNFSGWEKGNNIQKKR